MVHQGAAGRLPRRRPPTSCGTACSCGPRTSTTRPYRTSDNFKIVDTQGITYYPIKLNPALNPYVWTSQLLPYEGTYPVQDSVQSLGESQGGLVLFKLNSSAYSDRPLTFYILNHRGQKLGSISLDF